MYKFIFTILFIFIYNNTFSQLSFYNTYINKYNDSVIFNIKNYHYKTTIDKTNGSFCIYTNSKKSIDFFSKYNGVKLDFSVFESEKSDISFLLVNNYLDYSLGFDVFVINESSIKHIGFISVSAYNKIGDEPMNYNNILPYVSIVKSSDKFYFSFETSLVAYKAGEFDEKIIRGTNIHYTYSNNRLDENITK